MADIFIGKYKILAEIGKGGFGTVYRALDTVLDVERAVKVLHPLLVSDNIFLARFKQEAQLAAKLDHPNLVPVVDFGEDNGRFFLVMKYMPGGSLKDRIDQNGPWDEKTAINILEQAGRGVDYAHERGIIHRDLKPRNILFDEDGSVRVADLGFAKSLSEESSTSLSSSGIMLGTPAYMAPEIWRGRPASPASDIYSTGCIFYEMLTGKILFEGDSPADMMTKHVLDGPQLDEMLPAQTKTVLLRTLAMEPADRYKTISEFTSKLKALERKETKPQETPASKESSTCKESNLLTKRNEQEAVEELPSVPIKPPQPPKLVEKPFLSIRNPKPWLIGAIAGAGIAILVFIAGSARGWFSLPATPTATPITSVVTALTYTAQITLLPTETSLPGSTAVPISTQISSVDGMTMVYVPEGNFLMGSPDDVGDPDEHPQHTVYLDAYWIDQTEVTNAMYEKCVTAGACAAPSDNSSNTHGSYYGNSEFDSYPVIRVSWNQANAYCHWAGRELPTEAQWEKAARGTDGRTYPWGNQNPDSALANYNGDVWDTTEVGSYSAGASPYGALDMAGNVWEWVMDWYDENYYANSTNKNPTGPSSGTDRSLRGGSWNNNSGYELRVANRSGFDPMLTKNNFDGFSFINFGFRCSLSTSVSP